MDRKKLHIVIAYIFNVVFIVMSFAMMESYFDGLLTSFLIFGCLYIIYWIICNRKSYMPWKVYCHFCVGAFVQILLNSCGIIPEDGGWFSGLGQFFYVVFVIALTLIIGLVNLILFFVDRKRK